MKSCTKFSSARMTLGLFSLAFGFFSVAGTAAAQGYDFFQTGSGASVDLSSMNLGQVSLQGVPIENSTFGNTDTIMYRSAGIPQGGGNVPVSVYALYMESTSPVTYNGQQADVYVTINNSNGAIPQSVLPQPDSLSASTGNLTVYTSSQTFDSSMSVNADLIFVQHGGSPTNPSQVLGSGPAPSVTMGQTGSSYSTTAPPNYPAPSCYPAGGFYPLPVHKGPHPVVRGKTGTGKSTTPQSMKPALATCIANPQAN